MEQKDMTEWTDMLDMSREAEKVQQLLQSRDYPAIRRALLPLPPASVADILQELPEPQSAVVFRLLPKGDAAMAFSYLPKTEQKALIHSFTDTEVLGLVEQMHVDDSVDFLEELPANVVNRILRLSAPETRNLLNRYMEMPEGSAGSIMTAEFITLDGGLSASRAIAQMRSGKRRAAAGHMVYITGEGRKLEGILSLYDLLMAKEETVLGDLLDKAPVTASTAIRMMPPMPVPLLTGAGGVSGSDVGTGLGVGVGAMPLHSVMSFLHTGQEMLTAPGWHLSLQMQDWVKPSFSSSSSRVIRSASSTLFRKKVSNCSPAVSVGLS